MSLDTMIVDLTVLRIQKGEYIAGAVLDYFSLDEEGECVYTPYKVVSMYIDNPEVNSMNKCIKYLLKRLLKEIPEDVTRIVFRSNLPHFKRNYHFKSELSGLTDAEIRIKQTKKLALKELQLLANDALSRKSSVIGVVE